jgi:hypothetical protein
MCMQSLGRTRLRKLGHYETIEFRGTYGAVPERNRVEEHPFIESEQGHQGQILPKNVAPVNRNAAEMRRRSQKSERGRQSTEVEPTVAIQNIVVRCAFGRSGLGILEGGCRIDEGVEQRYREIAFGWGHYGTRAERCARVCIYETRECGILGGCNILPEEDGFEGANQEQMEDETDGPPVRDGGRGVWWRRIIRRRRRRRIQRQGAGRHECRAGGDRR